MIHWLWTTIERRIKVVPILLEGPGATEEMEAVGGLMEVLIDTQGE